MSLLLQPLKKSIQNIQFACIGDKGLFVCKTPMQLHFLVYYNFTREGVGASPIAASGAQPPGMFLNHKNLTAFYIKYFSYIFQQ